MVLVQEEAENRGSWQLAFDEPLRIEQKEPLGAVAKASSMTAELFACSLILVSPPCKPS
jgi:hypothetical protein